MVSLLSWQHADIPRAELDPAHSRVNPPDPVSYIVSENLVRRHLTVGQRAMLAEKLASLPVGRPNGNSSDSKNYSEAKIADSLAQMKNGGDRKSTEIGIRDRTVMTREEAAKMIGTRAQAISHARVKRPPQGFGTCGGDGGGGLYGGNRPSSVLDRFFLLKSDFSHLIILARVRVETSKTSLRFIRR